MLQMEPLLGAAVFWSVATRLSAAARLRRLAALRLCERSVAPALRAKVRASGLKTLA